MSTQIESSFYMELLQRRMLKSKNPDWAWWHTPFTSALRRQESGSLWVWDQPCLHSEFWTSKDYVVKPCLKNRDGYEQCLGPKCILPFYFLSCKPQPSKNISQETPFIAKDISEPTCNLWVLKVAWCIHRKGKDGRKGKSIDEGEVTLLSERESVAITKDLFPGKITVASMCFPALTKPQCVFKPVK